MRLFARSLPSWARAADIFVLLFADQNNSFWLDREKHPTAAFSVMGASNSVVNQDSANFGRLRELVAGFAIGDDLELPFDFRPGLVGYLSYEGAARFMLVDRAVVFDHAANQTYFLGQFETEQEFDAWYHAALLRLALVGGERAAYRMHHDRRQRVFGYSWRFGERDYLDRIELAKEKIGEGEVYQLCLTNRIDLQIEADPLNVFLKLRERNPAPYASYFKVEKHAVVSSSPEQFLTVSPSGLAVSRPIKGTRPRSDDPEKDSKTIEELQNNEKERAENLMIVDLMRNDLGRVCEPNTVSVPNLFEVESYATVHQLVSTIQGQLKTDLDALDALEALFPAGSMTGAPKLRAIEWLRQLEGAERGVYSGVIGYLGGNSSADFGMVIRSIVFDGDQAFIGVGGGLTIDSAREAEYEETRLKAKALLEVLGVTDW